MTANQAMTANACMTQCDKIVSMIHSAEDADGLDAAIAFFRFAEEMWVAVGYYYKVGEIKTRIKNKAKLLLDEEQAFLAKRRKNCRVRASTESNIVRLQRIYA